MLALRCHRLPCCLPIPASPLVQRASPDAPGLGFRQGRQSHAGRQRPCRTCSTAPSSLFAPAEELQGGPCLCATLAWVLVPSDGGFAAQRR